MALAFEDGVFTGDIDDINGLNALVMADAAVAPYTLALIAALPSRHQLTLRWRMRQQGVLIPAGIPVEWEAEVHCVEDHPTIAGRRILFLYFPELQVDDDVRLYPFRRVELFPFPDTLFTKGP